MRCPSCGTDNAPDSRFCGGCGTRFAVSGQRVAPTEKISDDARFPQHQVGSGAGSAVPITAPGVVAPRAVPAAPFMPQGAPPAQRPLAGGSAAPARPVTAPVSPRSSPRPQAVVMEDPRDATRSPSTDGDPRDATRGGVNRPALPGDRGREGSLSTDADPRDATRGGVNRPALPGDRGREGPLSINPSLSLPIAARRPWALIVVVLLIDLGLAGAGIWMLTHGLGDRPSRRSGELTIPAGAATSPPRPS